MEQQPPVERPGDPANTQHEHPTPGAVTATALRLRRLSPGKVRDAYRLDGGEHPRIALVATDRLSAFDVVLPTPIPGKGRLLTEISRFWMGFVEREGLSDTFFLSTDAGELPEDAVEDAGDRSQLEGRVTIGRLCQVIPVECVARGYLEGSGWKSYQASGEVCGIRLPAGLLQCDRLPEPVFTPTTKADQGLHDEPITFDAAAGRIGRELAEVLRSRTLAIYRAASAYALERGIIIADTKLEFGLPVDEQGRPTGDDPVLVDEALTPDSSRFWPADRYEPGRPQESFDKQFVREFLEQLIAEGRWDRTSPGPELPESVVRGTLDRYHEARDRLVG